jgi:hypothetical protein
MEHGRMKPNGPMDEDNKRRLVLKLVTQLRCMACGEMFDPHDFALVERNLDVWVLGIQCRQCGASSHVVVMMRLEAEPESISELTREEAEVVAEWPPISGDDVLDVHELLEEFYGDLDDLFFC